MCKLSHVTRKTLNTSIHVCLRITELLFFFGVCLLRVEKSWALKSYKLGSTQRNLSLCTTYVRKRTRNRWKTKSPLKDQPHNHPTVTVYSDVRLMTQWVIYALSLKSTPNFASLTSLHDCRRKQQNHWGWSFRRLFVFHRFRVLFRT